MATRNLVQRQAVLEEPYTFAMGVIMVTAFIVSIFYSLDALHGERRDRSILFWKSLPVSDLTTVLSKASVPLVVLPALRLCGRRCHGVDHAAAEHHRPAGQWSKRRGALERGVKVPERCSSIIS